MINLNFDGPERVDTDKWAGMFCHDERHDEPCPLPCDACADECDPSTHRPKI